METAKKLLAILLCFTMLSVIFTFDISVKAETQTYSFNVLKTGFEENTSKDSTFYNQASNGYANDDRSVGLVNSSGIGNNGSSYAMKMGYTNNPSNTNRRPVFSLRCSNIYNGRTDTQSFKMIIGKTYKLSFYYKAVTVTSPVQLYKNEYNSSLQNQDINVTGTAALKLADISSATDGYVHVETTFTAVNKDFNLLFVLNPTNASDVAGTTIYIDDITVMEQRNLESNYGTESFESASDMSGFNTYEDWAISTDQNHTESGSKSARIKIDAGNNSGANRPRMILKVAGNNFVATTGSTYIVSFWVYSSEVISSFNWYIYSSTSAALGSSRIGQAEIEKANVSLAVGWNKIVSQITVKGYNSSEHNYLQLGLTDSNATAGYTTKYFYVDDIKVQEIAETVTSTLVTQDFADIGTITGKPSSTRRANATHSGSAGSALITNTGYKSGVNTSQFYIPGSNEYARLCGEYNKRYRMNVSVYNFGSDVTAKIRWFGTTTLSDAFDYATNHRVIVEKDVVLPGSTWTDVTLVANINVDIFSGKNVYFTLGATLADSRDSTTSYTLSFDDISVRAVTKPGTPGAPVVSSYTGNSITLQTLSGGEYSLDGVAWQDGNVFSGLAPWTTYTIYQRIKETETAIPSDARQLSYWLIMRGDLNKDAEIGDDDYLLLSQVLLELVAEYDLDAADVCVDEIADICDLVSLDIIIAG